MTVRELRSRSSRAGEDGACGMFGVDRVALSRLSTLPSANRASDLSQTTTMAPKEACQTDSVGAATLDPKGVNGAQRIGPCKQLGIAGPGCGNRDRLGGDAAQSIDRECDMLVLVCIHAHDDFGGLGRDAWHAGIPSGHWLNSPVRRGRTGL